MKIPSFLQALYGPDLRLSAFTSHALSRIEDHIISTRMVFFPEYTDHGIRHIELTLQTALDFATAPARELLTPIDATALAVAVTPRRSLSPIGESE
jgi:molecular chaperone HtpG